MIDSTKLPGKLKYFRIVIRFSGEYEKMIEATTLDEALDEARESTREELQMFRKNHVEINVSEQEDKTQ